MLISGDPMRPAIVAAALLIAGCAKPADDPAPAAAKPEIALVNVWARSTVAGQAGTAAYLTVANFGAGGDRLVSVEAKAPLKAALHATSSEGGIAKMRLLNEGLAIPARQSVTLGPGSAHVMISGLTQPLNEGDILPLRLKFETSGQREIQVPVIAAGER